MPTDTTADVVIVGGGVIGASAAFHLARAGAGRVVVCERRWAAAGASGKSGALVRTHYTNEPEARLAQASLPYFHEWSDRVGRGDCGFVNTGLIRTVTEANIGNLRANVDMLERIGVDNRLVGPDEVREIAPGFEAGDVIAAAYEPRSGCADPIRTVHGLLEAAGDHGAELRIGTEVTAIESAGGRFTGVRTADGAISAPVVLVAGGASGIPLLRSVGVDVALLAARIQVALFKRPPAVAALHPICIDGINDMWLRSEGPGHESTLIGFSRRIILDDPDTLDEGVDGDYVAAARERLARRIPGMAASVMRGGWAGVITVTDDGKPILDRHPELDGLYFFTGDNGSSFKTAPAIGAVLAEWIVDGAPRTVDPRPFRLSRFAEGEPLIGANEYHDRDYGYTHERTIMAG